MWALSLRPLKEEKRVHGEEGAEKGRMRAGDTTAAATAAGNGAPKPENLLSEKQWLRPGPIITQTRLRAISSARDVSFSPFLISSARI